MTGNFQTALVNTVSSSVTELQRQIQADQRFRRQSTTCSTRRGIDPGSARGMELPTWSPTRDVVTVSPSAYGRRSEMRAAARTKVETIDR